MDLHLNKLTKFGSTRTNASSEPKHKNHLLSNKQAMYFRFILIVYNAIAFNFSLLIIFYFTTIVFGKFQEKESPFYWIIITLNQFVYVIGLYFGFYGACICNKQHLKIFIWISSVVIIIGVLLTIFGLSFGLSSFVEFGKRYFTERLKCKNITCDADELQSFYGCCGWKSYIDWTGIIENDENDILPNSCCTSKNSCTTNSKFLIKESCKEQLNRWSNAFKGFYILCLVLYASTFAIIFLAIKLFRKITTSFSESKFLSLDK